MASNDHPVHPAFVHFPIAFLSTAYALDIAYYLATNPATAPAVNAVYPLTANLTDISRLSHILTIFGLLTAIPATVSGGLEFFKLLQRQDVPGKIAKADGSAATVAKKAHPKLKVAFAHAVSMDLVVVGAGYNWWTKSGAGVKGAYAPSELNVLISALALPALLGSAFLGGKLVFDYGTGVNLKGSWGSGKKEE